jgi:uncharacterized protein (TIGR03437 family)
MPSNLLPGTYIGQITLTNTVNGQQATVQATTVVSPTPQSILLSQNAVTFYGLQSSPNPPAQSVSIDNGGAGTMAFALQTSTLDGASWLTATAAGNSVTAGSPLAIQIAVNSSGLTPKDYFGTIQVTSATVGNSPQLISVHFTVLAAGTPLGAQVQPGGVILTTTGGAQPIQLINSSAAPITYTAVTTTDEGGNWFTIDSTHGILNTTATINIQPQLGSLSPGIYMGSLRILFADGTFRVVSVLGLVADSGADALAGSGLNSDAERPSTSSPSSPIGLTFLSPLAGAQIEVGQSVTVTMQALDKNNNPVTFQTDGVGVGYGNSCPCANLTLSGPGTYSGALPPLQTPGAVTIQSYANYTANESIKVVTPATQIMLVPSTNVSENGIVNAGSFTSDSVVAPGSWIAIFGNNLADSATPASSIPLPTQLGNAQVQIGGVYVPLNYVSSGQINAQVPYSLLANQQPQIQVTHGGAQSDNLTVTIADTQPAIFTADSSGTGQGAILNFPAGTLVDSGNPTQAGQIIEIYCTGLGPTTPAVALGAASPSSPLAIVNNPVTVTIGGVQANVSFHGLTPQTVGLYQLNVTVPAGVPSGDAIPVIITVNGKSSPPSVTMAIQ